MRSQLVRIGSICDLINGRAFKPTDWSSDGLPIVRIQNLNNPDAKFNHFNGEVRERFLIDNGALLFAWSGTPGTSFGAHVWRGGRAVLNQHIFHIVFDKIKVNKTYFLFALNQKVAELIDKAHGGVGLQHVTKGVVEDTEIYLPSLDEQCRIVDVLSRADGIVRLRRQAKQKAAALLPALFVEMFGDPSTNPKGWPMRSVRELVARFEGGKNLQAASEGSTDFRILKVSAVTSGEYVEDQSKPTPDDYEPPSNHIVREGDMLFSRANTEELVGATAVVRSTNGRTLLPDKLWRFVWAEPVEQGFMHALFQSSHVRQELGKLSSGTSASMRNISQAKLFELRLPVPPLAQQSVFARHAEALQSIQLQQSLAFEKAMATFDALLARAFLAERAADAVHAAEGALA
jgi:type I restriction enzyme S subunit